MIQGWDFRKRKTSVAGVVVVEDEEGGGIVVVVLFGILGLYRLMYVQKCIFWCGVSTR